MSFSFKVYCQYPCQGEDQELKQCISSQRSPFLLAISTRQNLPISQESSTCKLCNALTHIYNSWKTKIYTRHSLAVSPFFQTYSSIIGVSRVFSDIVSAPGFEMDSEINKSYFEGSIANFNDLTSGSVLSYLQTALFTWP